jgi:hypothetical protein
VVSKCPVQFQIVKVRRELEIITEILSHIFSPLALPFIQVFIHWFLKHEFVLFWQLQKGGLFEDG